MHILLVPDKRDFRPFETCRKQHECEQVMYTGQSGRVAALIGPVKSVVDRTSEISVEMTSFGAACRISLQAPLPVVPLKRCASIRHCHVRAHVPPCSHAFISERTWDGRV